MEWERQEREGTAAFEAFKCYLMEERSYPKVAEKLSKSDTLIKRWAKENRWQERARAWDNELMRHAAETARRLVTRRLVGRLKELQDFQDLAAKALKSKDLSKASVKSLNEMYHAARAAELEIYREMKPEMAEEVRIVIEE